MKIGIIGYGSMGKMLVDKFLAYKEDLFEAIYVTNRTYEKIEILENECQVCKSCKEVAQGKCVVWRMSLENIFNVGWIKMLML